MGVGVGVVVGFVGFASHIRYRSHLSPHVWLHAQVDVATCDSYAAAAAGDVMVVVGIVRSVESVVVVVVVV